MNKKIENPHVMGYKRRFHRNLRKNRRHYKDSDSSIYKRVIKEGPDGAEFIISGSKEETFAQACRANWQFESVNPNSKWYIKDARGNDVTDKSLETVDGIFTLIPDYETELQKEEPDESDEYSSIHDGVTYYD